MKHPVRALAWLLAVTALVWLPPSSGTAAADPVSPTDPAERARESVAWLVGQLDDDGHMPGPGGRTDVGLLIDVLWALHATGVGAEQSDAITGALRVATGEYMGADLFGRAEARLAAQTAKLLVAAVVAGADPTDFGTGRFLGPGQSYDLRAETLALVTADGPRAGRVANTGTGRDDSNVFGQALAVVGLARSGGVPAPVVDYLAAQQCSGGWFRMFLNDDLTCDEAAGTPDGDGTALGLQALMVADAHGHDGHDAAIDRGLDWLVSVQQADGSFAGGAATTTGNANSTGLVVQTLVAGAERTTGTRAERVREAVVRAQQWITSLHVHADNPAAAALVRDGETGAIAYDRAALTSATATGIGTGPRDQWRRATAQALLALAPVSMANLGTSRLDEDLDPSVPTPRPEPTTEPTPTRSPKATPTPKSTSTPTPAPAPRAPTPTRKPTPAQAPDQTPESGVPPVAAGAGSPTQRLAQHLQGQLTDGTHVRSVIDGVEYVDHDLTVDVLLALHALDADTDVLARVTRFLARPAQVSAYAFGTPYEKDAAYAVPLARLSLALRLGQGSGTDGPVVRRSLRRVDEALAGLRSDGAWVDRGNHPDPATDTGRQAWITLALTAADHADAESASEVLTAARCPDGTYGPDLGVACTGGEPHATAMALAALTTTSSTVNSMPRSLSHEALAQSARTVTATLADAGLRDLADLTAALRALNGAHPQPAPDVLDAQGPDGSFTSASGGPDLALDAALAPVLAGRSWLEAPASPLRSSLPTGWHLYADDTAPLTHHANSTVVPALTGAAGLLAGVLMTLLATRPRKVTRCT